MPAPRRIRSVVRAVITSDDHILSAVSFDNGRSKVTAVKEGPYPSPFQA